MDVTINALVNDIPLLENVVITDASITDKLGRELTVDDVVWVKVSRSDDPMFYNIAIIKNPDEIL